MNRIDKHLSIPLEIHYKISNLCKKNKINYTTQLLELINLGLEQNSILIRYNDIENKVEKIKNKTNIIFELLKQIYADMDFENIKDVKSSYALNEFNKKINGTKYND